MGIDLIELKFGDGKCTAVLYISYIFLSIVTYATSWNIYAAFAPVVALFDIFRIISVQYLSSADPLRKTHEAVGSLNLSQNDETWTGKIN